MPAPSCLTDEFQSCSKTRVALIVALCLVVGTSFLILGYFLHRCGGGGNGGGNGGGLGQEFAQLIREADPARRSLAQSRLSADRIREHLRQISAKPHVATMTTDPVAAYVRSHWQRVFAGLDGVRVESHKYVVLLSRASHTEPDQLTRFEIRSADGSRVEFTSQTVEQPLTPYDNDTSIPSPILAYSPSGDVTGPAVYANYGSERDLQLLASKAINLTGAILLTRFGLVGQGQKAVNAKKYNASGVLIFSDPANVAKDQSATYPDGMWLPATGTLKGSAVMEFGDPATPGYPSLASAYRHDAVARGVFPPLPMYPIGYGDARAIIDRLEGVEAPASWRVRIAGMDESRPMRLGPGLTDGSLLRLVVNQENFDKEIENVCLRISGEIEPDRLVIVGNHRDAWGYGAVDPSSGTAVLMEFSQILADLLNAGWKPRRSILLCTWDGEEYGLIGSWEWVEENLKLLKESVVAYVNIDAAADGNYSMSTTAVPCLRDFAKATMDGLPEAVNPGASMGDTWSARWAKNKSAMDGMTTPLAGSDYAAFIELAGLPIMDIVFRPDPNVTLIYPMYHTRYESFHYVDTFIDPGFLAHLSSARLLADTVLRLADEYLLPYALSMQSLSVELDGFFAKVRSFFARLKVADLDPSMAQLETSLRELRQRATAWDGQSVDKRAPLGVRRINDAAMRAMQSFLAARGQPRQPYVNNLVFASGKYSSFGTFPGISDLLQELLQEADDAEQQRKLLEEMKQHLRALTYHVHLAAKSLTL